MSLNILNEKTQKLRDVVVTQYPKFQQRREKLIPIAAEAITILKSMLEHRQEHTELSDENEDEWILEYFANFWIWKISELPGPKTKTKYVGQRYWSKEAIKHYEKNGITGLRHEHVYPRKKLIEKIMHKCRNRDDIKKELKKITACIITKDEHSMLNNEKERWERYIDTGIKVVDLYKNKELSNEDLIDLNNKKNSYG